MCSVVSVLIQEYSILYCDKYMFYTLHSTGPDSAHLGHGVGSMCASARRAQRVRHEPAVERRRPALLGLAGPLHSRRSRLRCAPPIRALLTAYCLLLLVRSTRSSRQFLSSNALLAPTHCPFCLNSFFENSFYLQALQ